MNQNLESEQHLDVLLARQPIFDRNMGLFGYELLYRHETNAESAEFICGDAASSQILLNNYASLSQATEHHRVPAFINVTEALIKSKNLLPISPNQIVLEILEDVTPDKELINAIKRYKLLGFKIALDDYPFTPDFEPLLLLADYIKVDVLNFNLADIEEKLQQLKNYNAQLLAEKVEDHQCYLKCLKLGFHLFQGYFFEKPQIVRGKSLEEGSKSVLTLLSKLYEEDVQTTEVANLVSKDARLSYKLLKIVNSATYGLPRKVKSVKEAIVFLGMNKLKRWITLLSLFHHGQQYPELLRILLLRACCCELLAERKRCSDPESYFTAGLFSGIDSLLEADLNFLIDELSFPKEIKSAILQYKGPIGAVLKSVIEFQHANWDELDETISQKELNKCYFNAIKLCDSILLSISN